MKEEEPHRLLLFLVNTVLDKLLKLSAEVAHYAHRHYQGDADSNKT